MIATDRPINLGDPLLLLALFGVGALEVQDIIVHFVCSLLKLRSVLF